MGSLDPMVSIEDGQLADYDDVDHDLERAEAIVTEYVESVLAVYSIDFESADIRAIADACDIRGIVEENENNFSSDDESSHFGDGGGKSGAATAAIDDLFDRNR